jgi:hypothetical protein
VNEEGPRTFERLDRIAVNSGTILAVDDQTIDCGRHADVEESIVGCSRQHGETCLGQKSRDTFDICFNRRSHVGRTANQRNRNADLGKGRGIEYLSFTTAAAWTFRGGYAVQSLRNFPIFPPSSWS